MPVNPRSSHALKVRAIGTVAEHDTHRTDLIRLVQHVALNQSGWWKQAMERLVLACAYTVGPSSRDHLCDAVREASGVDITSERLAEMIENLLQTGSLVEHQESVLVSEVIREDLHAYEEKIMASEERRFGQNSIERHRSMVSQSEATNCGQFWKPK